MKLFRAFQHLVMLLLVGILFGIVEALRFGYRWIVLRGHDVVAERRATRTQVKRSYLRTTRHSAAYGVNLSKVRAWYAVPMTEEQFQKLTNLSVALRAVFSKQLTAVAGPSLLNLLFNVQNSSRAAENSLGIGELGDPQESGEINYDSFEPLYPVQYVHRRFNQGIAIERELVDDDEYGVMNDKAMKMGMAFNRFVEKQAASVFNNAFSTSVNGRATTGPDAVALCSASHPNSPTDSTNNNNTGTLPLTPDNIIATKIAMQKFSDNRGNVLDVNPDTIVVPVDLGPTAQVMVGSVNKPGTIDNDVNVNTSYRVITSRYLTDVNNWFMVDSQLAALYLKWYWRVRPEFTYDPQSDFSLKLKFRGYTRFSFGWDDWSWIYGQNVS